MRLLVDGDGCPNINEIKKLAKQYQIEMLVFIDYAHELNDDYFKTIFCAVGHDSVDLEIMKYVEKNDLIISQDYGLASLVLAKGAKVLHVSGLIINLNNIDELLMSRFIGAKARRSGARLKGPHKRTDEIKNAFLRQLETILTS